MPTISVVIPVHAVGAYLDQCLDSVLGQDGADVEVIAVDDASPDDCAQILANRTDSRLRVLHTESAVGPGRARELGMKQATGDYLWFVDGDDELAPGAVPAVAAELTASRPDLMVIDYENLYPDGTTSPSGARFPAAGLTTLAQAPALIHLTMTVWSKIFRREFLAGLGTGFGPGIHEDVPVSVAALLAAERIAVLPRVCYRYRRSRRGSFMAARSDRHFDILTSYNQIFDQRAVAPPIRAALFERAMWHYTTVLPLIPRARRREFFRRMTRDFRRWRPAEFAFPPGARGIKLRLVARGAYWTYNALEPVNKLRVGLRARSILRHASPLRSRLGRRDGSRCVFRGVLGLPAAAPAAVRRTAGQRRLAHPQPFGASGFRRAARRRPGGGPADRHPVGVPAGRGPARAGPAGLDWGVPVQRAQGGPVHPAEEVRLRGRLPGDAVRWRAGAGRLGHGRAHVHPVSLALVAHGDGRFGVRHRQADRRPHADVYAR